MHRKLIITGSLGLLLAGTLVLANSEKLGLIFSGRRPDIPPPVEKAAAVISKYDTVLVSKLQTVLQNIDGQRPVFTLAGTINMVNRADTSEKMDHVNFLMVKSKDDFYYRMGMEEAINESGMYVNIKPKAKKIFVTENKQVNQFSMIDAAQLRKILQTEEYELKKTLDGPLETISLINEKHYTCKEYAITFDTAGLKITKLYYRLANSGEPMNKAKEKTVEIRLSVCDTTANLNLYTKKENVMNLSGKLTAKYKGYELIHL